MLPGSLPPLQGCCTRVTPCGPGEGDCDSDSDCAAGLACGSDNCVVGADAFDPTDDCCEPIGDEMMVMVMMMIVPTAQPTTQP